MKKLKNKRNEKQKGVTLIALVVTIIVLLILAGISIKAVGGKNGIIQNAKLAKEETARSNIEDKIYLSILEAEQEKENATLQDVIQKLKENGIITNESQVDEAGKITSDAGYEYEGLLNEYIGIEIGDTGGGSQGENEETLTKAEVQDLINQSLSSVNESINEINNKLIDFNNITYNRPTPVNGVTINSGGYTRFGDLVIVALGLSIDTSKLSLSVDVNNKTTILKDMPKSTGAGGIYASYPVKGSGDNSFYPQIGAAGIESARPTDLVLSVSSDKPYTSKWGLSVWGFYVSDVD